MQISPFKLERYFAEYEFKVRYLLSPSDCESLSLKELLSIADAGSRQLWEDLHLGYTESQGNPILREEISRMYEGIDPEEVVVAVPEEAIFIAMQTLLRPGDQIVAIYPAYQSLYQLAESLGCEVIRWKFEFDGQKWRLDLNQLENTLTEKTRLLVINFPHNPTGYLPNLDEFRSIIGLAEKHGIYVFSDEMYRMLEYDPEKRLPSACDLYPRAMTLSGLSKSFALPGLRVGWLVSHDKGLREAWMVYKDYTTICNSAPSEILGVAALRVRDVIIARNLDIIQDNLELARHFFEKYPDKFTWIPPQAGSVAFPRWNGSIPIDQLARDLVISQEVMVVPGNIFDCPGNYFRVGLGRKTFADGLMRFDNFLQRI